MKHVIAVLWQTGLMIVAAFCGFVAGMIVPSIRVQRVLSQTATSIRTYDFNWIIAVLIVFVLLLLVGALLKRFREMAITATVALVITLAGLALFTQIGVKDVTLS
jgi:ABC-type uncharacterized transport system permease subunit